MFLKTEEKIKVLYKEKRYFAILRLELSDFMEKCVFTVTVSWLVFIPQE